MNIITKKETVRLAMPVNRYDGLDSTLSQHFGKAPGFIVVDATGGELTYLDSAKARRASECAPIQALVSAGSRVVLANSMGRGAMARCLAAGMQILQAEGQTVAEVLEAYRGQHCPDFPDDAICSHHEHSHSEREDTHATAGCSSHGRC